MKLRKVAETYFPSIITIGAFLAFTRSWNAVVLLAIPATIAGILFLRKASSDAVNGSTVISVTSLFLYVIWYGLGVLDCGNASNWFDLSGCSNDVVSGIIVATVVLLAFNAGLLGFTLLKQWAAK